LLIYCGSWLNGQSGEKYIEGTISYITSKSVYVQFKSTENISVGDTLYIMNNEKAIPVLQVLNKSSISCVCAKISDIKLSVSDKISFKQKFEKPDKEKGSEKLPVENETIIIDTITESQEAPETEKAGFTQSINGRLSVSSFTNFSNTPAGNSQRMKYTFSLDAEHIAKTGLSAETYISFIHGNNNKAEIKSNIFNGLKIYNLALNYDFNKKTRITIGRKINPKISNLGANDGLQFESQVKSIFFGAVVGSRPDYTDYSYNFKYFQFGAYVGHNYQKKNGSMITTLAFVQQMNNWNTDRRILYLQHSNTLLKKLFFFGTVEFNLYKLKVEQTDTINLVQQNTFEFADIYLSFRYKIIRQLSLSFSYSNRKNTIYYETYKNYIERLMDSEALQGFRLQVNYRPVRYLSIGLTGSYRYRKSDPSPTSNLYGYLTYSRIPVLNVSATLSATMLNTSYTKGKIYSLSLNRDIIPGKLSAGGAYRNINYNYSFSDLKSIQNVVELNLLWFIFKHLSFSVYYEGTFDKQYTYTRIYANLTQRF